MGQKNKIEMFNIPWYMKIPGWIAGVAITLLFIGLALGSLALIKMAWVYIFG